MAWSYKAAVEKVTQWNAAAVNNVELGIKEAKEFSLVNESVTEEKLASALLGPTTTSYGLRKLGSGSTEARAGSTKIKTRTPHAWVIQGAVTTATLPGITIVPASGEEVLAVRCDYKIISGTKVEFELKKGGTAITGFTALKAEKAAAHKTPTAVALAEGEEITLVVTVAEGSPEGFSATLQLEHIAS